MSYDKYFKAMNELNNLVLNSTEDEVTRYSESDIFWTRNKKNTDKKIKYYKGDVCQFEFGKNYVPEMSYEHRGLIIGVNKKLLYVLPICSKNPCNKDHKEAYHPIDNPRVSNFYLLKNDEFNFLKHDSVLKLNDLRTVSVARSKYKQGNIAIGTPTYKEIERMAFSLIFPPYSYDYDRINRENEKMILELEALQKEREELLQKLDSLQKSEDEVATSKE